MRVHARNSGLLVAERAAVPRAISDALRRLDPGLELRQDIDEVWGMFVWRVFVAQPDRPSAWLFDWRENLGDGTSRPRPLSHAIVDEAAARKRGETRRATVDPLVENERLAAIDAADETTDMRTAGDEVVRRHRVSSPVKPSRGLQIARQRARAKGAERWR